MKIIEMNQEKQKNTIKTLMCLFCFCLCFQLNAQVRQPNIVVIMADDLGYETIQVNGGESYKTPHLNKMAVEGVTFDHCYSQPLCTPSRVQIMSGQYNFRNYHSFGYLEIAQRTFAQALKSAGYKTCIAGKWQLNGKDIELDQSIYPGLSRAKHFGFDNWCLWQTIDSGRIRVDGKRVDARFVNPILNVDGEMTDVLTDKYGPDEVSNYILDFISENKNDPFLVYYPMILTHCPFWPTPDSEAWSDSSKRMPGHSYKGEPRFFGDMVNYMDKLVGRLIAHIDSLGLAEDTLIIFTGDNGTDTPIVSQFKGRDYPGCKGQTNNGGTHVPMIVRWEGKAAAGTVSQNLVDFSDVFPTVLDASNTARPEGLTLDGYSFLPQIKGEPSNDRKWIYCWYSRSGKVEKGLKVFARNQRYKLYESGKMFDLNKDENEKSPVSIKTAPETRKMLQDVLNRHRKMDHRRE